MYLNVFYQKTTVALKVIERKKLRYTWFDTVREKKDPKLPKHLYFPFHRCQLFHSSPCAERKEPSVYSQVNLPHNSVAGTNCSSRKHWTKAIEESRIFVVRDRIRTSLLTRLYGRCFTLPAFHLETLERNAILLGELFFQDQRRGNSRINERLRKKLKHLFSCFFVQHFYTETREVTFYFLIAKENGITNIIVKNYTFFKKKKKIRNIFPRKNKLNLTNNSDSQRVLKYVPHTQSRILKLYSDSKL